MGYHPQQVQDFIPTPGTLSTCMWYTGLHPLTGEPVYSAKRPEEKRMQRALMQYWLPRNHAIVRRALRLAHREDLIGYGAHALVPPAECETAHRPRVRTVAAGKRRECPRSGHGEQKRKRR